MCIRDSSYTIYFRNRNQYIGRQQSSCCVIMYKSTDIKNWRWRLWSPHSIMSPNSSYYSRCKRCWLWCTVGRKSIAESRRVFQTSFHFLNEHGSKKRGPKYINSFFQCHPIQRGKAIEPLLFDDEVFHFHSGDGQTFKHNWLTYHISSKKPFCSVCLAFTGGSSVFLSRVWPL